MIKHAIAFIFAWAAAWIATGLENPWFSVVFFVAYVASVHTMQRTMPVEQVDARVRLAALTAFGGWILASHFMDMSQKIRDLGLSILNILLIYIIARDVISLTEKWWGRWVLRYSLRRAIRDLEAEGFTGVHVEVGGEFFGLGHLPRHVDVRRPEIVIRAVHPTGATVEDAWATIEGTGKFSRGMN